MRLRKHTAVAFGCFALLSAAMTTAPTAAQESSDADPFKNSLAVNAVSPPARVDQERAPQDRTATLSSSMLDEQTRQRLQQPLTLEYDEEAWSDVEAHLESKLGVNILLDQSARDDCLHEDELISFQIRDVPGNHALRLMLGKWNATYFVRAGVVRIISLDDVQNGSGFFARKVFDVDDLLGAINQWNHLHQLELKKPEDAAAPETPASESPNANHSSSDNSHLIVRASAAAGQHGGPGNGFGAPVVWRRSLAGYQLTDLIYQSVDGDQWLVSGSGNATMSLVCGHLVVYGPETLISDIDELLSDLKGKLATD